MQTIIVDMTPGYRMPTIYFSQGDVGTQFAIDLRSRFGDSLPASPTVTIQATKPSGFGFTVAATSLTNGVAVFTTTAEMTDEAGRFPAELKVVKDNVTLFSANFGMEGEANTHPAGTIDGSQETVIPELTQLVERAEDAASSVLDRQTVTNTLPAGSQATYSFDEGTNTQTFGIPQGEAGAGAAGVVASAYSSSNTYAVGDYVIHNSNLYRCTTAITTAESFTAAHWTQVVLADDVSDVKSEINELDTYLEYPKTKIIHQASISGSGVVLEDETYDMFCQEILTSDAMTIAITSGSFVYGFFSNEPSLDSVSYNSSRTYSGSSTASGVSVPSGVKWIAVRVPLGTKATITPKVSPTIEKLIASSDAFDEYIELQGKQITANNYASQLPDANSADNEATYVLTFAAGSTSIPANLPVSVLTESNSFLTSIGEGNSSKVQFFAMGDGVWYRFKVNASLWSDWVEVSRKRTFHVGTGQPYTTIRSAVAEAIKYNGTTVYVHSGTYDLLSEFSDIIADFPQDGYQGIKLENDVHLIFSPNAKVTFLYTGSDTNVKRYFSPFFSGVNGGFIIEGLNIKASNCRYCIHEDAKGVSSNTPYFRDVIIKNCDMYIDNSNNTSFPQCVGGGLTDDSSVQLLNNVMRSAQADSYANPVASWHGCASGGTSRIVASGNYCVGKGTLRFNHYGIATAEEATKCLVDNNSLGSAVINGYENQSTYPNANMSVYGWNNEIRS